MLKYLIMSFAYYITELLVFLRLSFKSSLYKFEKIFSIRYVISTYYPDLWIASSFAQILVFLFSFIFTSWRLITILQWVLPYIDMNQPWIYMCFPSWTPLPPPSPSHPSGSPQCTIPEHLSHASNLGWLSVSLLIIHMFPYCSLRSSYPRLLP